MVRGLEQARTVTRWPVELGRLGVRATVWSGKQMVGQTVVQTLGLGRVLTLGSGEQLAERLRATQPLSEAQLGAQEVSRGLKEGDNELTALGDRRIARAVIAANRDPKVSDEITGAVVDVARDLPVDPLAAPSVSPELADEARGVITKFSGAPEGDVPPAG
jgi:hypothetical protein